ncbi:unnamed protein product [Adineta steineri]|uniref:Uncharacterized protein n=1 Tax=Adineta steineri TaxID=433720 RepID=A0A815VEL8_9BILA|nr:unnamed protein product [Adineta steineri]
MLSFNSYEQTTQTFNIMNGPSITLNHVSVQASVHIDDSFHQEIRQILKKDLPTTVRITLLFTPNTIIEQQLQSSVNADINAKILKSLIPLKSNKNEIIPSGYVFIGLGTHQSTGIGMHVFSHFIPTIERENLDLENPHISKWNQELLLSTGQIARFIYDQTMNRNSFINNKQEAYRFISSYSFEPSVPNNKIGDAILSGFFHTTNELFVSVQQSPSNSEIRSISSKQAYLAHSPDIYTFLTLPLIPYNLVETKFFKHLEQLKLIAVVNHTIIEKTIPDTVLLLEEFINLVRWLCKNKTSLQRIFSSITYRENITSSKISLKNIQYYINKNIISSILPLPSNILPVNVSIRFSSNELEGNLSLSKYNSRQLVDFYLLDKQHYLLRKADTSLQVLNLICQQSNQFCDSEWNSVQSILSNIKCIPTTQGMKIPNQSYIPSTIPLLPEVPKITINLTNDNQNSKKINKTYQQSTDASSDFVSKEFLKQIGCCTFHLQSFIAARHASSDERIERLIQELIEERSNMTDIEFEALKQTEWLRGTTNIYYIPRQLCFPSVAIELNWPTLLVIDWPDIKSTSQQYLFLKQLGVREVPDLQLLIDRISQEHNAKSSNEKKNQHKYQLPKALSYFIKYFQQHYSSLWTTAHINQLFLPSRSPTTITNDDDADNNNNHRNNEVILSKADQLFQDDSPLCNTLLPQVMELFSKYSFDIARFNIKKSPSIDTAFGLFMERKNELLFTIESTRKIFAYLNQIYEWNDKCFNEYVSRIDFIPLQGSKILKKPCEVFIRSDNMISVESSINNVDTSGLIDYVDFGEEGNSFLKKVGVCCWPSASVLAQLLLDRQANYFASSHGDSNSISAKYQVYITFLEELATKVSKLTTSIKNRLQNEPWCVGHKNHDSECGIFEIVKPGEVFLDDHYLCAKKFEPLCAPYNIQIQNLYEQFGSPWLSTYVKITSIPIGRTSQSNRSEELRRSISHRFPILFVDNHLEQLPGIDESHLKLLETTLSVYENDNIRCDLTFQGKTIILQPSESMLCALIVNDDRIALYLQANVPETEYLDVATSLAQFVLRKPSDEQISIIKDKLSLSLEILKRRNVPVNQLEEQKEKQLKPRYDQETESDFIGHSANLQPGERHYHYEGVDDFGPLHRLDDTLLRNIIHNCRRYTEKRFTQEDMEPYIEYTCETNPSVYRTRYKELFHSIPLYIEQDITVTKEMLKQANQLAWVLSNLAQYVFELPINTFHLFRDINGCK